MSQAVAADGAVERPIHQWAEGATLGAGGSREGHLVVLGQEAVDYAAVDARLAGEEGGELVGDEERGLAATEGAGGGDAAGAEAVVVEGVGDDFDALGVVADLGGEEVVLVEDAFAETQVVVFEEGSTVATEDDADEGEVAWEECTGVVVVHACGVGGWGEGVGGVVGTSGIVEASPREAEQVFAAEVAIEHLEGVGLQVVVAIEEEDIFAAGVVESRIACSREATVGAVDGLDVGVAGGIAVGEDTAAVGGAIINAYSLEVGIGLAEQAIETLGQPGLDIVDWDDD